MLNKKEDLWKEVNGKRLYHITNLKLTFKDYPCVRLTFDIVETNESMVIDLTGGEGPWKKVKTSQSIN